MGSMENSLSSLSVYGFLEADGENSRQTIEYMGYPINDVPVGVSGGGSGGTILLFLNSLTLGDTAILSTVGGLGGSYGGGGGGGGRIHFEWAYIPTGDEYLPVANVKGE
ncbi:hypothetical protein QJS10_CPB20g00402 [Acorus calamus]|uniref:Uncharacterized protein n=1 Tax=Acorus calamus TaxID=4465 RepID=A0AAV9CCS8_ACOCL|nr:hypothetical protein QJS10_CPB20g00402 [Acorus calamus]